MKYTIVSIGELLGDFLSQNRIFGGNTANFAFYASKLGCNSILISALGLDSLGVSAYKSLLKLNLHKGIQFNDWQTSGTNLSLPKGCPHYLLEENVAWDYIKLTDENIEYLKRADAFYFGLLSQRGEISRYALWDALDIIPSDCLKIFDVSFCSLYDCKEFVEKSLKVADVVKLNKEEVYGIGRLLDFNGTDMEICYFILNHFCVDFVVYTIGEQGSMILSFSKKSFVLSPVVCDDDAEYSFLASLILSILNNETLHEAHLKAVNVAAGFLESK